MQLTEHLAAGRPGRVIESISLTPRAGAVGDNMMADRSTPGTIDDYIAAFPPDVRSILQKIRLTVRKAAPQAEEKISYKIPSFALNGALIYFAAFKKHIGLYPPVRGDDKLRKEIARYRGEKGNLKFPLDEPIPYKLIARVVKFRVKEHLERTRSKRKKK
jgi:uncharacterized protein YdhG (YjbR/CyaY superfamily)